MANCVIDGVESFYFAIAVLITFKNITGFFKTMLIKQ
jgi:hypothetical protein